MKIDLYNLKMLQTKKEKKNEYNRLRYQRKKEEIKAKQRLYAHENREYRSEQKKLYYKSSDGIKFRRIGHWRNSLEIYYVVVVIV